MAGKEHPSIPQTPIEPIDEILLSPLVKINHHIPAKDKIEWSGKRKGFDQVQIIELNQLPDGRDHEKLFVGLPPISLEVFVAQIQRQSRQLGILINSLPREPENPARHVGGQNPHIP